MSSGEFTYRPRHLRPRLEAALVRLFGRRVDCAECGRELFTAVPVVFRGRLWVLGAKNPVRVSFASPQALEFRHVELDQCASPTRPWVAR